MEERHGRSQSKGNFQCYTRKSTCKDYIQANECPCSFGFVGLDSFQRISYVLVDMRRQRHHEQHHDEHYEHYRF